MTISTGFISVLVALLGDRSPSTYKIIFCQALVPVPESQCPIGTGADTKILWATTPPPPPHNFQA